MKKQYAYRITGLCGHYDGSSDNRDKLIQAASQKHRCGTFTMWKWNGKQWKMEETFQFL